MWSVCQRQNSKLDISFPIYGFFSGLSVKTVFPNSNSLSSISDLWQQPFCLLGLHRFFFPLWLPYSNLASYWPRSTKWAVSLAARELEIFLVPQIRTWAGTGCSEKSIDSTLDSGSSSGLTAVFGGCGWFFSRLIC